MPLQIRLLLAALLERQIVLISESKERRTAVAFCLVALLDAGGCKYRHTFLPVVPPDLCVLQNHMYPQQSTLPDVAWSSVVDTL